MAQIGPPFDFSKLDEILGRIMGTPKIEVLVGYPSGAGDRKSDGHGGEINNATLAAIHDLGLGHMPERPFVRQAISNRREVFTRMFADELRQAYAGTQTVEAAYNKLGLAASKSIAVEIARPAPAFQPLTERTIKRKKSSRPLWDTGQLAQSSSWVLRQAGETK